MIGGVIKLLSFSMAIQCSIAKIRKGNLFHYILCEYSYIEDNNIPLTTTIVLSEALASLKPLTDAEQVYCPPSFLNNGENVIVLVYSNPLILISLILDDGDAKFCLSQLTITSDDDTPGATVTVQVRL